MKRAHEWLGVEEVKGPRLELRPFAYIGAAGIALLCAVVVIRAAPGDTVTAALDVVSAAPPRAAIALEMAPPAIVPTVQPAAPARVSMELAEAAPARLQASGSRLQGRGEQKDSGPGILGAPGLGDAIARVAGNGDVGGAMADIADHARAGGWTPDVADGIPANSFGATKKRRECPLGEHKDPTLDKCVPDNP